MRHKDDLLQALHREIVLRKDELSRLDVESIYFGGGTPSLIEAEEIQRLIDIIVSYAGSSDLKEVTLEANPDDLTESYLTSLAQETAISRLSIGVQSFHEKDLTLLGRAHNAQEAKQCLVNASKAGFDQVTLDLIFGIPYTTMSEWEENLQTFLDFGIGHLSCYGLTVEERTQLAHQLKTNQVTSLSDDIVAEMFLMTHDFLTQQGYEHYEISNYAQSGCQAYHNNLYWASVPYIGFGPAAHSYDGQKRYWNVANNAKYIRSITEGVVDRQMEVLTDEMIFNEWVMTRLRLGSGLDLDMMPVPDETYKAHIERYMAPWLKREFVTQKDQNFRLTRVGMLYADAIAQDLFLLAD